MASTFRYSTEVASSQPRPPSAVFFGWKLQGMKAVNPPVSSCRRRTDFKMIDALVEILANAEHHGRGGAHAELMCRAVHADPIVRCRI